MESALSKVFNLSELGILIGKHASWGANSFLLRKDLLLKACCKQTGGQESCLSWKLHRNLPCISFPLTIEETAKTKHLFLGRCTTPSFYLLWMKSLQTNFSCLYQWTYLDEWTLHTQPSLSIVQFFAHFEQGTPQPRKKLLTHCYYLLCECFCEKHILLNYNTLV